MNNEEKEKFREHINKFSKDQTVGWLSAISFISPMEEVSPALRDKLKEMFYICADVIKERSDEE